MLVHIVFAEPPTTSDTMPDMENRPAGTEHVDAAADQDSRYSELRDEIDRLRLENQRLYAQVADTSTLGYTARVAYYTTRALAGRAARNMRRVVSSAGELLGRGSDQPERYRATSDNAAPYRVRSLRQAPQASRCPRIVHVIA